jgi:hypothetical protein
MGPLPSTGTKEDAMLMEAKTEKALAPWEEEVAAVAAKHNGLLRAEDVVEFAADPKTALHAKFTWEDTEAARLWRLLEARNIIAVVVVYMPSIKAEVRAYVSLTSDRDKEGGGYRPLVSVLAQKTRREELLADALADFDRWKAKYEMLVELAEVFEARRKVRAG